MIGQAKKCECTVGRQLAFTCRGTTSEAAIELSLEGKAKIKRKRRVGKFISE